MKKYSNILVALGVTLFLLAIGMKSEAEAQTCCPSGLYTQITVTNVTHPASGCKFSITYCYYDGPGGDRKLFICNINVDASQSCNYNNFNLNSSFWSFVDEVVRYDLHSRDPFDPCVEGGGQTNMIVESSKAKCQKVYYDMILDAYIVEACDAEPGLCVSVYSICASNGSLIKTDISGPTYIGGGDCPTTPPNINSNTPTCFNTCQ
jgi:hypothetical protein